MRLAIRFADRVGIAHEILAVLAGRRLNVVAVEVGPPYLYVDAPGLDAGALDALAQALIAVAGVETITPIDVLPGLRRQLQLDALLGAMADPVFGLDEHGAVLLANPAAAGVAGRPEAALAGVGLDALFGEPGLQAQLRDNGFRLSIGEVQLEGAAFLAQVEPLAEADGRVAGGVLTLHAPSRMGERLHALQNPDEGGFERLLGDSPPMRVLKARAARVAAVEAPLLILGETGTGKELIAHACHHASRRRGAPFLALNCAALPESLAESELFGYAPGAFSGAQRGGKPGLLELADRGTVFLDEIGEMSPYLQAKLLRFLNDGSFRRVGGSREQRVDVRIVSATHRDLERMVAEGRFREDLWYRLNVLTLTVPPLRERGDDIRLLAGHFTVRACAQTGRPPCRIGTSAAALLRQHLWPGNVRQLENVVFRAVTMSDRSVLEAADFELADNAIQAGEEGPPSAPAVPVAAFSGDPAGDGWFAAVERCERELLARLWPQFPSSRRLAAHLGTSHTMIAKKLRKYRIGRES